MIIAVDPGLDECGLAAVNNGSLIWAALARRGTRDMASKAYNVVDLMLVNMKFGGRVDLALEKPQIYTDRHRKGSQEPLIDLAILLGRITGLMDGIWDYTSTYYMPAQWKGQVPKHVHHARLTQMLEDTHFSWRDRVDWPPKSLQHNVYDAIGLAFHHSKVLTSRAAI